MTVKEETEKVGLKLNIQKMKIVASWSFHRGFAGGEVVKKKKKKNHLPLQEIQEMGVLSVGREVPWSRKWQSTQYSCLETSVI